MNDTNYPILEKLETSEFDERIEFLYQSIAGNQLCWMAFEHLEEILTDRKIKKGLFFSKEKNTIAIRSKSQRLLARIWFESKPVESSKRLYHWSV
ncbi:MAG: hypothetical protein AAF519_12110 [Bacteroidota bacterium]